ncbi:MAG: hypothetical protein RI637_12260, partial [Acidimicrobiia bacterium]|nr:hypothetical protein [Acidimicrobiia bacterium]
MKKRLAVMGLAAVLVLGSATVAMAAGGGKGPGANPDCPGDCTGRQLQLQERAQVENEATQLQTRIRVQDGSGDQVMNQVRTQAQLHE